MELQSLIEALERESGGKLAFACHDLQTGRRFGHRAAEPVPTASVIKLPILVHVALAVADGELSWGGELALSDGAKVPGTGILKQLSDGLSLSVRDLCVLMTALSDNTATNMLIGLMGLPAINERMAALGFPRTRLLRQAFTPDTPASRPFGLGVTTADETADLLVRIARRELGDAAAADTVLELLAMQQDRAAIPRLLPQGWAFAGKSGSNEDLRNDVGLLTAPDGRRFALAVFCTNLPRVDWSVENAGLLAIARLARALVDQL